MAMLMSILLVFLTISALAILVLNALAIRRHTRPGRRGYFVWGIVSTLLALVPLAIAIAMDLGDWDALDYFNFMPFVLFMCLFFIPAALMSALIGIYEPPDDVVKPSR